MQGIIIGAHLSTVAAEVLARVWLAGLIPVFVGLALIFNGYFVSRKAIEAAKREGQQTGELTGTSSDAPALKAANTKEFIPTPFSVTEDTTKHFK
jgi:hypothetical protein